MRAWELVMVICLWAGWGLALAGAIMRSLSASNSNARQDSTAAALHGLALLVMSLSLLLAGVSGLSPWLHPGLSSVLAIGGASLALLAALVLHPTASGRRQSVLDLTLAWLVVAAGAWGSVVAVSVI